jgi:selenocysteine lyase/cysteine desulfurase
VEEITRFVHGRGAKVCVDGVAYAPHRLVDVHAWDVDFYVLSLYKVFGPHLGLLYGKREHLLELSNINHLFLGKDAIPYKLQPGNLSYELAYAATPGRGLRRHRAPRG